MHMNHDMAAYFDKMAPTWDDAPAEYGRRDILISMMGLPPGSLVADVGCGRGVMFEHLLKVGPSKIVAVDLSQEMLRLAKERFPDSPIEYVWGDYLEAPLPMLDAAVFFNSYPHFLDKVHLAEKSAQVIQPGGALIIAHSLGRTAINAMHGGGMASGLSMPLESAEVEAGRFDKHFTADLLIDHSDMFFVKLSRK